MREYRKAIAVIDDALEEEFPYPSVEKLKELRKNLKKLIYIIKFIHIYKCCFYKFIF